MRDSYGSVVEMLTRLNGLQPEEVDAFKARLRRFQGEGIPAGANTGKGKRASYSPMMVLELAFAVELLQVGFSPRRAKLVIERDWDIASPALVYQLVPKIVRQFELEGDAPLILAMSAAALNSDADASQLESLAPLRAKNLDALIEPGDDTLRRLVIFDVQRWCSALRRAMGFTDPSQQYVDWSRTLLADFEERFGDLDKSIGRFFGIIRGNS